MRHHGRRGVARHARDNSLAAPEVRFARAPHWPHKSGTCNRVFFPPGVVVESYNCSGHSLAANDPSGIKLPAEKARMVCVTRGTSATPRCHARHCGRRVNRRAARPWGYSPVMYDNSVSIMTTRESSRCRRSYPATHAHAAPCCHSVPFRFFAWYPAHSSPPAILADMLASMYVF